MPSAVPSIRSIDERDDHFIVTEADGSTYRVDKDGLEADTLVHIQGMAHGGLVIAGGTRVDPGEANPLEADMDEPRQPNGLPVIHKLGLTSSEEGAGEPEKDDEKPEEVRVAKMADGGMVAPDGGSFISQPFMPLAPSGLTDAGAVPSGLPPGFVPGGSGVAFPGMPDPGGLPSEFTPEALATSTPYPGTRAAEAASQPAPRQPLGPEMLRTEQVAPPPAAPPQQQQAFQMPALPGVPSQVGELNRGIEEQRAALQKQAETEAAKQSVLLELADRQTRELSSLELGHREAMVNHQRRADDLFNATLSAKIDPNRIWANADLGQRMTAGIAIILSGIGQGLGGGPNLALQQIDRMVDLDVDAQKTNLAKQQTLLSHYLQQGRDMLSAHQLAKADLKDMYAGELMRVAAQFGGQEAAARAQLAVGELRTTAAGLRSNMLTQDYQRQLQRAQMQQEIQRNALMQAVVSAPRTAAGGVQAPPQVLEALPKDVRERAVFLPDGSIGFAPDAHRAQKYQAGAQTLDTFRKTLQRYRNVLESGSPVRPAILGGDRTKAQSLRQDLLLQLKELKGLGVLQKLDLDALEPLIPDITAAFTSDKTLLQGLDALADSINNDALTSMRAAVGRQ
jgi:hypothetical protein